MTPIMHQQDEDQSKRRKARSGSSPYGKGTTRSRECVDLHGCIRRNPDSHFCPVRPQVADRSASTQASPERSRHPRNDSLRGDISRWAPTSPGAARNGSTSHGRGILAEKTTIQEDNSIAAALCRNNVTGTKSNLCHNENSTPDLEADQLIHHSSLREMKTRNPVASSVLSRTPDRAYRPDWEAGNAMGMDAINSTHLEEETFQIKNNYYPYNTRQFLSYKLRNGLKMVLISDPHATMAAARMHVKVGSWKDPAYMQGLAHLVEHALFLGTEEYPDSDYFKYFLNMWGGSPNGGTNLCHTDYYFTIMNNGLQEALQIFSSMFVCPLFDDRLIMEIMNVDHEARLHQTLFSQMQSLETGKNHFGTAGTLFKNPLSRGMDIIMQVRKFFREQYSSNLMTVVVMSRDPLEELSKIVDPLFARVQNNNLPFLTKKDVMKVPQIRQIMDFKYEAPKLLLSWPIMSSFFTFNILRQWLLYSAEANLYNKLREKNLSIYYETLYVIPRRGVFHIQIDVTEVGRTDVVDTIFQCISKLQDKGMDHKFFIDTCKKFQDNMFLIDDEESCVAEVAKFAEEATSMKTNLFNVYNYRPEDKLELIRSGANELSFCNAKFVFAYNNPSEGGITQTKNKQQIGNLTWYNKPILNLKYFSHSRYKNTQYGELFCHLVRVPFCTLVRTENQIAYSVSLNLTDSGFCVQIVYDGDNKAIGLLQIKLAQYMLQMHTYLDNLSEETFATHRDSLAYKKFEIKGEIEQCLRVKAILKKDICSYAKTSQVHFDQ